MTYKHGDFYFEIEPSTEGRFTFLISKEMKGKEFNLFEGAVSASCIEEVLYRAINYSLNNPKLLNDTFKRKFIHFCSLVELDPLYYEWMGEIDMGFYWHQIPKIKESVNSWRNN